MPVRARSDYAGGLLVKLETFMLLALIMLGHLSSVSPFQLVFSSSTPCVPSVSHPAAFSTYRSSHCEPAELETPQAEHLDLGIETVLESGPGHRLFDFAVTQHLPLGWSGARLPSSTERQDRP